MRTHILIRIHCLAMVTFLCYLGLNAAEQPPKSATVNLDNKVIIYNNSKYPIVVKTSDPKESMRIADKAYSLLGIDIDDVERRKLSITEFGHAGDWQAKGEKKGTIPVVELINREKAEPRYLAAERKPFIIMIITPEPYGLTGRYSNWENRYTAYFELPIYAFGEQKLPAGGDPYDIPDFKGVKDQVTSYGGYGKYLGSLGAKTVGYASIEEFKQKDPIRWARLVLGQPRNYTKESVRKDYIKLMKIYHTDRFPNASPKEIELLNKIAVILGEARDLLDRSIK